MMNLNLLKKNQKKFKFDGNEKYIFNSKNDPPKLTISELGITNNANIFPISKDNSILRKKIQDYIMKKKKNQIIIKNKKIQII